MSFSAYEVFSIITGILLMLCAAMPDLSVRHRIGAVVAGAFFVIYGFYVASRTTGTYEFPVFIFVVPFFAVAYLGYKVVTRAGTTAPTSVSSAPPRPSGPQPTTFGGVHAPSGSGERRCKNRSCDAYLKPTRRVDCLRCEHPTAGSPLQGIGAKTPVPVRRFAHLETRWCADVACSNHLLRTADLVCRRCRADTSTTEAAPA